MNKRQRELKKDLGAARPPLPSSEQEWIQSEEAKQILARVLESPPETKRRRSWVFRPAQLAWIGGLVVVALALGLSLALARDEEPQTAAGPETTVTSTSLPAEEFVDARRVLEHVIAVAQLSPGTTLTERPGHTGAGGDAGLMAAAAALGVFGSESRPEVVLSDPVTRTRYAVWLWRVFGSVLPMGDDRAFSDLSDLSAEEQEAVGGLARAGILEPYVDGTFRGSNLLSPQDETAFLERTKDILKDLDEE